MLTSEEQQARREFYADVFGADQLALIEEQREHLWPVQYYQEKIEGLSDRGFANPVKMITSLPAILNLSFDNINHKLRLARRLGVDAQVFITHSFVFISMSARHYVPLIRACRRVGKDPTPRNIMWAYKKKLYL